MPDNQEINYSGVSVILAITYHTHRYMVKRKNARILNRHKYQYHNQLTRNTNK